MTKIKTLATYYKITCSFDQRLGDALGIKKDCFQKDIA